MTIAEALAEISITRADLEVLLSRVLSKDRSYLLAHPEALLTTRQWKQFCEWTKRRALHEPTAYIVGEKDFFGRMFAVDPRVLVPRSSTEGLVELALDFLKTGKEQARDADQGIVVTARKFGDLSSVRTIIDVGTGSGCIAITIALERPDLRIVATDLSEDALSVARKNAQLHGVSDRVVFIQGRDLVPARLEREPFIVLSNPPYIPPGRPLSPEVMREPHLALFDREMSRRLIAEAQKNPLCRGIVLECETDHVLFARRMTKKTKNKE